MEMETKNYKVDQLTANPLMDIKSVPGVTWLPWLLYLLCYSLLWHGVLNLKPNSTNYVPITAFESPTSKPELQMEYSLAPMNASKPRDVDLILSNELLIATQMIIHEENEQ
jgi:hypothetical protein